MMSPISSLQNPRVKEAVKLRERRGRDKQGRILIEGVREISRALTAGVEFTEVFVCEPLCQETAAAELLEKLRRKRLAELVFVRESVMAKLSFGDRREGILAVARPPKRTLAQFEKDVFQRAAPRGKQPLLLGVVEGVEKPGNLGAILRTADAAGLSGLIIADGGTDLFNPAAIRASLGAIFTVPVVAATSAEALAWLRKQRVKIFATRVEASVPYSQADFTGTSAIVLGSESEGLSKLWTGDGITAVSLPMRGQVDSLNLSVTAAILFYEALRQTMAAPQAPDRG